jgi:hypothetical protein
VGSSTEEERKQGMLKEVGELVMGIVIGGALWIGPFWLFLR